MADKYLEDLKYCRIYSKIILYTILIGGIIILVNMYAGFLSLKDNLDKGAIEVIQKTDEVMQKADECLNNIN